MRGGCYLMKKSMISIFIIFLIFIISWSFAIKGDADASKDKIQRKYIGVTKCKTCHKTKKHGEQFRIWSEGPHAKAYATLANEQSKAIAKEKGIENAQEAGECLKCHITAYGVDSQYLGPKHKTEDGVGCESCHGAGGDYWKMKTMKLIYKGELDPASVGLITDFKNVCIGCHNEESPTYKEFVYDTAIKTVSHPIPKKQ